MEREKGWKKERSEIKKREKEKWREKGNKKGEKREENGRRPNDMNMINIKH